MAIGGKSSSVTLFTEFYERKFIAQNGSWGHLFHIFLLLVIFILPFILTFSAGTFWAKQDIYQEQPKVIYKNKLFTQLMFTNPTTLESTSYIYSTSKAINNQQQNLLCPPSIYSSSQDFDRDGMAERWNISMRIRKPADNMVLSQASIIAAFDYQTSTVVKSRMETLAITQINFPTYDTNPVRSVKTLGTLDLKQLYPMRVQRGIRTLYDDDLFGYLEYESVNTFLNRYTSQRNETTVYNYDYFMQRGLASDSYIDISMIINIPTYQDILYIPDVWEVLKFAWIQYYSFLILIYVFLYHFFYGFIIKNKVFETVEVTNINLRAITQ